MTPIIFGSLVLFSDRQLTDLYSPYLNDLDIHSGAHINDRHKGLWTQASDIEDFDVYLPQRYKRMSVLATSNRDILMAELSVLDSNWDDARHLYKLGQMMKSLAGPMIAVVNSVSTSSDGLNGSFYLLAINEPLYINLVFDLEEHSVRLTWSTFDLKKDIQDRKQFRYIFYALPILIDRPLFINSQNLCGRWWKLRRSFGETKHGLLRACNALELALYKDPTLPYL